MVEPRTFLVGCTQVNRQGIMDYLNATGQQEFWPSFEEALMEHGSIALVSFYAKLCYKSLTLGKNQNVSKIRDIEENIKNCFDVNHGSVFEHVYLNFVTTDCSRIFTHELVRHRVGTSFSQTSGRYVALDSIDLVLPPEITSNPVAMDIVNSLNLQTESSLALLRGLLITESMDFAAKKKLTSAIRRLAPNGQTNEIGWGVNIRALRHLIVMRTNRSAEWEIRLVFNQVADIVEKRFPLMLYGLERKEVDGQTEWS